MTLDAIAELGLELRRLGWRRHLEKARELYAATRDGHQAEWTIEHAERLRAVLGQGPSPIPVGSHCPRWPPPLQGTWSGTRTMLHFEDRWVCQCSRCGSEWVRMVPRTR